MFGFSCYPSSYAHVSFRCLTHEFLTSSCYRHAVFLLFPCVPARVRATSCSIYASWDLSELRFLFICPIALFPDLRFSNVLSRWLFPLLPVTLLQYLNNNGIDTFFCPYLSWVWVLSSDQSCPTAYLINQQILFGILTWAIRVTWSMQCGKSKGTNWGRQRWRHIWLSMGDL